MTTAPEVVARAGRSARTWVDGSVRRGLHAAADARRAREDRPYVRTHERYAADSMIEPAAYVANLRLAEHVRDVPGDVVECGTWRGGMIAGIAERFGTSGPDRTYHLFDSFEGLPPATEMDGTAAAAYQANEHQDPDFDNCAAEVERAEDAMRRSGAARFEIHRGWFDDTLPAFAATGPRIALLRLDGDWYDSTLTCLRELHHLVAPEGMVVIDDYDPWDGCSRAVHAFLAERQSTDRIQRFRGVVYLQRPHA